MLRKYTVNQVILIKFLVHIKITYVETVIVRTFNSYCVTKTKPLTAAFKILRYMRLPPFHVLSSLFGIFKLFDIPCLVERVKSIRTDNLCYLNN